MVPFMGIFQLIEVVVGAMAGKQIRQGHVDLRKLLPSLAAAKNTCSIEERQN